MVKPRFGRLEQVRLNDIWNGEGQEFLPWLGKAENLSMIGEVLGQDLSVERHGKGPGPQSAFLLCRDSATGARVIIENPVTTTEYDHLGYMLAHALQYSPSNILWMAGVVADDHQRLLSWLNGVTDDSVSFFALEISFWRIGDSPFAPNFELVASPNFQARTNGAGSAAPEAESNHQGLQKPELPRSPSDSSPPLHPDQRAQGSGSGLFQKREPPDSIAARAEPPRPEPAAPPTTNQPSRRESAAPPTTNQPSRREPAAPSSPQQAPRREPQTPSGLLRAAAARPPQGSEPPKPSGLFQRTAAQTPKEAPQSPVGMFQRSEAPAQDPTPQEPSGLLRKAAAQREEAPDSDPFVPPSFEATPADDADAGRHPTLVSYADEPEPPPTRPKLPISLSRDPEASASQASAGLMKKWQTSEATVTPSGMLHRMEVSGQPSEAEALGRRGVASDLDPTEQVYLEFWTKFWEDVVQWESELPPERPMAQGWVTFPIGREDFYLVAFINAEHSLAGMGLVLEGPESAGHYRQLHTDKDAIEAEFGYMLDWRELPAKEESHIYLHKRDVDLSDRRRWVEYQQWFGEALETFTHVLGTRVRSIDNAGNQAAEALFRKD